MPSRLLTLQPPNPSDADPLQASPKMGIWELEVETGKIYFDQTQSEIYGFAPEATRIDLSAWSELVEPSDRERMHLEISDLIRNPRRIDTSFRILAKDGTYKAITARGQAVTDPAGITRRLVGVNWEMPDFAQTAVDLAETRMLTLLAEHTPLLLALFDSSQKKLWLSRQFREKFCACAFECDGSGWPSRFFPLPEDLERMQHALANPRGGWVQAAIRTRSGALMPSEWAIVPLSGKRILLIGQDSTAAHDQQKILSELKSRLAAQEQWASMGKMAAGIAHEINNPLAIILGKCQQLLKHNEQGSIDQAKATRELGRIEETALRLVRIVRGLKSLCKKTPSEPMEAFNMQNLVEDTLDICQERFRNSGTEVHLSGTGKVMVSGRPGQISQVLMNLLSNSLDAVEAIPEKWVKIDWRTVDGCAELSVTDSGGGIQPALVPRLMEPLFTTKAASKGTGLGLSICASIVRDHGGSFTYDASSPHTRFVARLPLAPSERQGEV